MKNQIKGSDTAIADLRQFASVKEADAALASAADSVIEAVAGLTGVIGRAVLTYRDAGMSNEAITKHVKAIFADRCRATVNHALRKAGVRQRGMRSDIGLTKDWTVNARIGWPTEEKAERDADGKMTDDDDETEPSNPVECMIEMALKLSGGKRDKAAALLKAAAGAI